MSFDPFFEGDAAKRFQTLYMAPSVVARRRRALEILDPKAGERVIDIGYGPGFFAADMCEKVGEGGLVSGVDASESMRALALERCARYPQADLRAGQVTALPFPDGHFDAALASNVYSYVGDVNNALAEMCRILRPGGRGLVIDFDWGSLVWHAADDARMDRITSAWMRKFDDPYFARTFRPHLRAAGLTPEHTESIAMFSTEIDPYVSGVTALIGNAVIGSSGINAREIAAWEADLENLAASDEYFFSLNQYLFLVRKPL